MVGAGCGCIAPNCTILCTSLLRVCELSLSIYRDVHPLGPLSVCVMLVFWGAKRFVGASGDRTEDIVVARFGLDSVPPV